jgi:hypothetical protein
MNNYRWNISDCFKGGYWRQKYKEISSQNENMGKNCIKHFILVKDHKEISIKLEAALSYESNKYSAAWGSKSVTDSNGQNYETSDVLNLFDASPPTAFKNHFLSLPRKLLTSRLDSFSARNNLWRITWLGEI